MVHDQIEGSRIITEFTIYSLSISGTTRAPDGMLLRSRSTLYALAESGLPKQDKIMQEVRQLIANLEALRKAPVLEPYTGPAILDGGSSARPWIDCGVRLHRDVRILPGVYVELRRDTLSSAGRGPDYARDIWCA